MITFVLLYCPMTLHYVLYLSLTNLLFYRLLLLHLLFILFSSQSDLTLLPKQRLVIISRYNFLICIWLLISFYRWVIFLSPILELHLRFNDNMRPYYLFFLYFLRRLQFYICWLCEVISHYIFNFLSYIFNRIKNIRILNRPLQSPILNKKNRHNRHK